MSPRETDELDMHHVELLSIADLPKLKNSNQFGEIESIDNIIKIQYSFGVVSVLELKNGDSWSCNLDVIWHRPKSVMVYVSLGYSSKDTNQRANVHRSLQIEGKIPVVISHRDMTPFRHEPLLISNIRSVSTPRLEDIKDTLALNENNILVINAKNCTEVPLKLVSLEIVTDVGTDSSEEFFSIKQMSGVSDERISFVPGEEFRWIFSVTPLVSDPNLSIGTVCLKWTRDGLDQTVVTNHSLPRVSVEEPPLVTTIECPPFATLGIPFSLYVKVKNKTSLLQEIKYTLGDSQNFVFSGGHIDSVFVLPGNEHVVSYKFVALASGTQIVPRISITSVRYSAMLTPSLAAATIFVYPSEPLFGLEKNKAELVV